MIKIKLEVTYSTSGSTNNQLTLGAHKFDMTRSQLEKLQSLLNTYLEMSYVSDKVLESSI